MNRSGGRTVRVAHAHGNRRETIDAAIRADVDFIEADIWHRADEIWVRHERRLGFLPLLYDRRPRGVDNVGPWAGPVFPGRYYARLDVDPIRLTELLERTRGQRRLLLDLKNDEGGVGASACARTLTRTLAEARGEESVIICGQTDVLDNVREADPELDIRYSIEKRHQWDALPRRLDAEPGLRGVCMAYEFLTDRTARFLKENGLDVFCWTVDDLAEARRLIELGVDGIISNSIPLLERLDGGA